MIDKYTSCLGPPPKIVCLCGSTKFKQQFLDAQFRFTMAGYIVLSVGCFMHADKISITFSEKEKLDELHKRKIELADEVFIVNVDGYIGNSTTVELEYAEYLGKMITYLENPVPY